MASEPQLVQDCDPIQGHKQQFGRCVKFVIFCIFVAVSILVVQYGVEQFQKIKIIVKDRLEKMDSVSLFYIVVGCVFVISILVNMNCLDRNSCKMSESAVSPVPSSG